MPKFLQKYQTVLPASALALLLIAGSPAVALARGGEPEPTTTSGTTATVAETEHSTTEVHTMSETSTAPTTENETDSPHVKGEKMVKALKAEHKPGKTDEERTKSCDEHKNGLETKFASITRNSEAYKARIDAIYAKTLDYKTTNNLNPTGIGALIDTADAAKKTAAKSITALSAAKPTVDCTSKTVATDVATFKVTASTVRTDLKAYKQAVKAVVKSLRDASEAAKPTTTTESTTDTTKAEVKN